MLDNLVTDRPDNAPPLAGKAFHGVSLMLAAIHGTSFSESMKHANLVYTRCKLQSSQMLDTASLELPLLEKAKLLLPVQPSHPVLAIYGAKLSKRLRDIYQFVA